jgi:hypothetical protein
MLHRPSRSTNGEAPPHRALNTRHQPSPVQGKCDQKAQCAARIRTPQWNERRLIREGRVTFGPPGVFQEPPGEQSTQRKRQCCERQFESRRGDIRGDHDAECRTRSFRWQFPIGEQIRAKRSGHAGHQKRRRDCKRKHCPILPLRMSHRTLSIKSTNRAKATSPLDPRHAGCKTPGRPRCSTFGVSDNFNGFQIHDTSKRRSVRNGSDILAPESKSHGDHHLTFEGIASNCDGIELPESDCVEKPLYHQDRRRGTDRFKADVAQNTVFANPNEH